MILGLTGHIASGKSSVAKILERHGALIVDADQLARQVVARGSSILAAVVERFGGHILTTEGDLDRGILGEIVFNNPEALHDLNKIMHPAIRLIAEQRLAAAVRQDEYKLIVYDAALLFEVGADRLVDKVVLVFVDPQEQLKRLMIRNGFDETEALQRISAQAGLEEKKAKADYLIDNSGSLEDLEAQVSDLVKKLPLV